MPGRTLHAGDGQQHVLAHERSDHGFSGESRGGHARRERLPQAGLHGSHRRWAARQSLIVRSDWPRRAQDSTARHVTTPAPERYFSTEWPERRYIGLTRRRWYHRFLRVARNSPGVVQRERGFSENFAVDDHRMV